MKKTIDSKQLEGKSIKANVQIYILLGMATCLFLNGCGMPTSTTELRSNPQLSHDFCYSEKPAIVKKRVYSYLKQCFDISFAKHFTSGAVSGVVESSKIPMGEQVSLKSHVGMYVLMTDITENPSDTCEGTSVTMYASTPAWRVAFGPLDKTIKGEFADCPGY